MSGTWGGKREHAGRKTNAHIQHLHDLVQEAVTDDDWKDIIRTLKARAKRYDPDETPAQGRLSNQAAQILFRYQYATPEPVEEHKQEVEPISFIEIHRSCEQNCPIHPEYHRLSESDPPDFPNPLPPAPHPMDPDPHFPAAPLALNDVDPANITYDDIPIAQVPSYKFEEPDFLDHIRPYGALGLPDHPTHFPPGDPRLSAPAPSDSPLPVQPTPPAPPSPRDRILALIEQDRQAHLQGGITPTLPAPVPPTSAETPCVTPTPDGYVPLPRRFHSKIGRVPLSRWGVPPGKYILPSGKRLQINGKPPKPGCGS